MKVFAGSAVLLVLVAAALGAHHQTLAEPPVCPEPVPGVSLNITFYPNEDDCTKYWECDNGNLYNGSCADGLIWNPNLDSCDWTFNYDCPYDKKGLSLFPSQDGEPQFLAEPPECPEAIPGVSLNLTFYPNEDDCTKYWECDNGNLLNGSCADGLIWNPNVDSCDWPYNYDCPYDNKGLSLFPSEDGEPQLLADPPECPDPIPGESLNITFYPNEDDCSKYWECDNGNLYNGSCADGLIWNPNVDSCDWPFNYDCPYDKKGLSLFPSQDGELQLLAEPPECPEAIPGVSLNLTFYPNEDDCTKYWECDNGNLYNGSCSDGLIWNPNVDSCDWPWNYDCPYDKTGPSLMPTEQAIDCPEPPEGEKLNVTFYPNEEDCTKYWSCDNGELLNGTCSDGLIWNPNVNTCDWPYNYDCPYDKRKSAHKAVGFVCPPINRRTRGIVMYYPHEYDIQKYWECLDGEAKERNCDSNMVWDPTFKKCVIEFL